VRPVSSSWAPVVAALGAAFLTGFFTWGAAAWAQRRADKRESLRHRREGYQPLLNASNLLISLGFGSRVLLQARTGVAEGIGLLLRIRRPVDSQELQQQYAAALTAILDAQDALSTVGSQAAVETGEQVAMAAANYLSACADMTSNQKRWLALQGWKPTKRQEQELEKRLRELSQARAAFVHRIREDLGEQPIVLSIDRNEAPGVA